MKRRLESEDLPIFENAAKCEHPCHSYTNESFGTIGCIFAENGPLECGIEVSFIGAGWDAKGNFRWVLAFTHAFSKGAPTIFRKHMPWSMGTESLRMIGCIFAENGPLEGGIESNFSGTGWGAKGYFRWIFDPNPCIFEGAPHHFPKAHALRYGHRQFGDDRVYIRWEWPLEGGVESSFSGTGWGAKGDFRRYSYLYPYIFESRTHTFFESTCPEIYAQQSWEWSDAYSWRNYLWKVNFKRGCKKQTGVLMVIWSGFLAHTRAFSKEAAHHFQKALALRYRHRKFGNDQMYIRGEWALRRWHWIKFQWYRLGC